MRLTCNMRASGVAAILWIVAASVFIAVPVSVRAETAAFIGVNVLPMDSDQVLSDQTVIVRDGLIIAMGEKKAVRAPKDAVRIDGAGRYLMPGLSDMHAHIAGYGADDGGLAESQLFLYLATGITTIRDASGTPTHLNLRERVEAGEILGPRLYVASPIIEGEDAVWESTEKITSRDVAAGKIAEFAAQGYDFIKIYHTISEPVYSEIIKIAAENEIRVFGHVPFDVGIDRVLEDEIASIEHLRGYDFDGVSEEALERDGGRNAERFSAMSNMSDARKEALIDATVAAHVWNTPTLAVSRMLFTPSLRKSVAQSAKARYLPPQTRSVIESNRLDDVFSQEAKEALHDAFPVQQSFVKLLHEGGGRLLTGTDSPVPFLIPGLTPIDEIQMFAQAGLSPFEAIRASAYNSAEFLGEETRYGVVAVGKETDLILLEGDPLSDLDNLWRLSGVLIRGHWLSREEIDERLEALAASYEADDGENSHPKD